MLVAVVAVMAYAPTPSVAPDEILRGGDRLVFVGDTDAIVDLLRINGLVPAIAPSVGVNNRCVLLGHNPDPSEPGTILIKYSMMQDGPIRLLLTDTAGNILRTLLNESRTKGSYTFRLKFADWYLPPGKYTYRLESGGQVFQRSL